MFPGFGQQARFRSAVDTVTMEVSVQRDGRPVQDLEPSHFVVFDNGVRQTVLEITREPLPLDVTVLLDASGSMDRPSVAARQYVENLRARLPAEMGRLEILDIRSFGDEHHTDAYDQLADALLKAPSARYRRVVLVVTDALDTISALTGDVVARVADRAAISVSVLAIAAAQEFELGNSWGSRGNAESPNYRELRRLATRSGGEFAATRPKDDPIPWIRSRLEALRHRYVLNYHPNSLQAGWHQVRVQVSGRNLDVRHREGYWR